MRGRRGFTLIELMVVVLIIAILAGLGAGVAIYMLERAKVTGTLALVSSVETGCKTYLRTKYNSYPLNGTALTDTNPVVVQLIGQRFATPTPRDVMIYLDLDPDRVQGAAGSYQITDFWGGPIAYANWLNLTPAPAGYASGNAKNNRGIDIWSFGPDAADNSSSVAANNPGNYGDDIAEWNKD